VPAARRRACQSIRQCSRRFSFGTKCRKPHQDIAYLQRQVREPR
jgi:hypothetical protein